MFFGAGLTSETSLNAGGGDFGTSFGCGIPFDVGLPAGGCPSSSESSTSESGSYSRVAERRMDSHRRLADVSSSSSRAGDSFNGDARLLIIGFGTGAAALDRPKIILRMGMSSK